MAKVANEYLSLSSLGEFPSDWNAATLSLVCSQVTDGTHDSPKPVVDGGYPLVTGKAIKDRRIDFSVTYNISNEEHQKVMGRSKPERGDILFANIGNSIGDLVRVKTDRPFSIKNVALFKPNITIICPRYLEYFLLSAQVQGVIKASTRGSAQPFIGLSSLRGFPIALPPMDEQRNIGTLLGALDDRISVLRETNSTLEALAQALFKSWFVDFDPVRSKQQGHVPHGMDEATTALFPDSFEESGVTGLPRGWSTCAVYDMATYINGAAYKAFHPNLEGRGLPIIKIAELKTGVTGQTAYSDVVMHEKYRILTGDILFSWSGNPDTSIDTFVWPYGPAWVNQHIFRVVPKMLNERAFLLRTLKHMRPIFAELARNKQTTGLGHVTVADLKRLQVVKPPHSVLERFDHVVAPVQRKIFNNDQLLQTLATLRDTLLPRLISGQLRLPNAAEIAVQLKTGT
jgi:type I restriction enzyme S subunit